MAFPYQLVRNILAASIGADGRLSFDRGHALVLSDERNPTMASGGVGDYQWIAVMSASRMKEKLRRISWQSLITQWPKDDVLSWLHREVRAHALGRRIFRAQTPFVAIVVTDRGEYEADGAVPDIAAAVSGGVEGAASRAFGAHLLIFVLFSAFFWPASLPRPGYVIKFSPSYSGHSDRELGQRW